MQEAGIGQEDEEGEKMELVRNPGNEEKSWSIRKNMFQTEHSSCNFTLSMIISPFKSRIFRFNFPKGNSENVCM